MKNYANSFYTSQMALRINYKLDSNEKGYNIPSSFFALLPAIPNSKKYNHKDSSDVKANPDELIAIRAGLIAYRHQGEKGYDKLIDFLGLGYKDRRSGKFIKLKDIQFPHNYGGDKSYYGLSLDRQSGTMFFRINAKGQNRTIKVLSSFWLRLEEYLDFLSKKIFNDSFYVKAEV